LRAIIPSPGTAGLLVLLALAAACGSPPEPGAGEGAAGAGGPVFLSPDEILAQREQRDEEFRTGENSPLAEDQRAGFTGLEHFPPDPAFQFEVFLHRYERPEQVSFSFTGKDGERPAVRWGYVEFSVDGTMVRLQAYRLLRGGMPEDHIFIPFRDLTTGRETYGGGRYLELPYDPAGRYALDFNLSFYPYCAYNPVWSCPVPPRENDIGVAIRAGERGLMGHPPAGVGGHHPAQEES
jgi:uncharacterized protein (DUF1684 family)